MVTVQYDPTAGNVMYRVFIDGQLNVEAEAVAAGER